MRIEIGKDMVFKLIFAGAIGAIIYDRVQKHKSIKNEFEQHKKKILGPDTTTEDIVRVTACNRSLTVEQSVAAARYLRNKQMEMYLSRNIAAFDKAYGELYSLIGSIKSRKNEELTVIVALWQDEMERAEKRQAELDRRALELQKLGMITDAVRSLTRVPQNNGVTISLKKEN